MRLCWLTDIHLDLLDDAGQRALAEHARRDGAEAVVITGDIAQQSTLVPGLEALQAAVGLPVYFVLGNHDAYGGSIAGARRLAGELSRRSAQLRWLPEAGVVPLTARTGLVGHDGWADTRGGDWEGSEVQIADYVMVEELIGLSKQALRARLTALGDEAASHLRAVLPPALERFETVVVLIHAPPFVESCWHEGSISAPDWLPHFTCVAAGMAIVEVARAAPHGQVLVLCGHTHSPGIAHPLPNVTVLTGAAEYGEVVVPAPLEVR